MPARRTAHGEGRHRLGCRRGSGRRCRPGIGVDPADVPDPLREGGGDRLDGHRSPLASEHPDDLLDQVGRVAEVTDETIQCGGVPMRARGRRRCPAVVSAGVGVRRATDHGGSPRYLNDVCSPRAVERCRTQPAGKSVVILTFL